MPPRLAWTFWARCQDGNPSYSRAHLPAAAYVSGLAALMVQHSPGLTQAVLQPLLEQSAKDLGAAGKDPRFGSGLVDGCRAMLQLTGGARLCR